MSTPKGKSGSINMSLKKFNDLKTKMQSIDDSAKRSITRTVSDFKSRAPAWISTSVTAEYGIKKADVKNAISGTKKVGKIKIAGTSIDNIAISYSGRTLTPIHFKMRPSKIPLKREGNFRRIPGNNIDGAGSKVIMAKPSSPYTITAEIKKGKRVKIKSGQAFLGTNRGTGVIPFQRVSESRTPIKSIKTLSVPQMITNKKVRNLIQEKIDEGLSKRLQHYVERELQKRG